VAAATAAAGAGTAAGAAAAATAATGAAATGAAATAATAAAGAGTAAAATGTAAAAVGFLGPIVVGGGAAIASACTAYCLCFHIQTTLLTRKGVLSIAEINVGDEVLTQNGTWTRVLNTFVVAHEKRPFDFVEIRTTNASLAVTKAHPVIVKHEGEIVAKEAGSVVVGDVMVQRGDVAATVIATSPLMSFTKSLIQTEVGSVLADGLLVKTPGPDFIPATIAPRELTIADVMISINQKSGAIEQQQHAPSDIDLLARLGSAFAEIS